MADPVTIALAALTILGAAFVQGITGFGHALLAIGPLSVLLGPKPAILVLTLLAPLIALAYWARVRAHVDRREVLGLSLPLCLVGMPLGIWLFTVIDSDRLEWIVGALLVLFSLWFLSPWAPRPRRLPIGWSAAAGFAAGVLGGLTSTGGPPLVLYLYAREMDKEVRMAILQGTFVVASVAKVIQVAAAPLVGGDVLLTRDVLVAAAILGTPVVIGVLLGERLFRVIPAAPLRRAVLVLLVAIGVLLILGRPARSATEIPPPVEWSVGPHEGAGGRVMFAPELPLLRLAEDPEWAPDFGTRVAADESGRVAHAVLENGWAYSEVVAPAATTVLVTGRGFGSFFLNGERFAGDPYRNGLLTQPVRLREGVNRFLVRAARGEFTFRLEAAPGDASLQAADATIPDLRRGTLIDLPGAVVVLNHLDAPLTGAVIEAGDDRVIARVVVPVDTILPLGAAKPAIPLRQIREPREDERDAKGRYPLPVILRHGATTYAQVYRLPVRDAGDAYDLTRISGIDGSVQYHAVREPDPPAVAGRRYSLYLSLHGAGVPAVNQARAYEGKPDAYVVCPTNRRPFGFDWQDWGRLDALEVLDWALENLPIDPDRVYLTGHSMGGHGTWYLGSLYADRFAAIMPSAGWESFFTYGGSPMARLTGGRPALEPFRRAQLANDTRAFLGNLADTPVYVLHGENDDNVPLAESKRLTDALAEFHDEFRFHVQPGAGHWWGARCVDWPAWFDFARRHVRNPLPRHVSFATPDPAISSRYAWVRILGARRRGEMCRVTADHDPRARRIVVTTENVAGLELDLRGLLPFGPEDTTLVVDGEEQGPVEGVVRVGDGSASGDTFRMTFSNRMVWVYGTRGTPEENAAILAKVRYDAAVWRYRANGAPRIVADREFRRTRAGNLVLYGNEVTNSVWKSVVPAGLSIDREAVTVGDRTFPGDMACYRAKDGVAVVGATTAKAMRMTGQARYFISGATGPDWVVFGDDVLLVGLEGVAASGFSAD